MITIPLSMINIRTNYETALTMEQIYINKNPDFQREYESWDDKLKTRFIETMLLGRSMNPIWTILNPDPHSEEILDGMHRITTATDFLNNKFKLVGKHFSNISFNRYDKKYFKELDVDDQSKIRNYNFIFNNLDSTYRTDVNKRREMYEILNKSSKSLNEYEYNKVLYGDYYNILKEHKDTCNIIINKKDKRGDIESEIIDLLALSEPMPNSWTSIADLRKRYLKDNLGETEESVKNFLNNNKLQIKEKLVLIDKTIIRLQDLNLFNINNKKIFNKYQISHKLLIARLCYKFANISIIYRHIKAIVVKYNKLIINDYFGENNTINRNAIFQKKLLHLIDEVIDNEYVRDDPSNARLFTKQDIDKKWLEQNVKCKMCSHSPIRYQGDHIIPWSQGGKTIYDNLQVLCISCHNTKSTSDLNK